MMNMFNIEDELRERLMQFNDTLKKRYKSSGGFNAKLLSLINNYIGEISDIKELNPNQVANLAPRGVVAVDGSINTAGSSYPHYVAVMRSLAQSTIAAYEPIYKYEIYSPLFVDTGIEGTYEDGSNAAVPAAVRDENRRSAHMARLEIEAAIEAIKYMEPSVMMMDGSLAQFRIKCRDRWEDLCDMAIKTGTILIGVVEEIKTAIIKQAIEEYLPENMRDMYDRELLFGLLRPGQMISINEDCLGQGKLGLAACFARTSMDPHPIAIDMPVEQALYMKDMAALVYALSPRDGRGVPLWLDMIDNRVRITTQMMEALIDEYIDPDIRHRLLVAKRQNRDI